MKIRKQNPKEVILMKSGLDKHGHQQYSEVRLYNRRPNGWKDIKGSMTAPEGTKWIENGKSIQSGQYKSALVKVGTKTTKSTLPKKKTIKIKQVNKTTKKTTKRK